jgi:hypothetical protein
VNVPFRRRREQFVSIELGQYRKRAFDDKRQIGCDGHGFFPQVIADLWNFG